MLVSTVPAPKPAFFGISVTYLGPVPAILVTVYKICLEQKKLNQLKAKDILIHRS